MCALLLLPALDPVGILKECRFEASNPKRGPTLFGICPSGRISDISHGGNGLSGVCAQNCGGFRRPSDVNCRGVLTIAHVGKHCDGALFLAVQASKRCCSLIRLAS